MRCQQREPRSGMTSVCCQANDPGGRRKGATRRAGSVSDRSARLHSGRLRSRLACNLPLTAGGPLAISLPLLSRLDRFSRLSTLNGNVVTAGGDRVADALGQDADRSTFPRQQPSRRAHDNVCQGRSRWRRLPSSHLRGGTATAGDSRTGERQCTFQKSHPGHQGRSVRGTGMGKERRHRWRGERSSHASDMTGSPF